MYKHMQDPVATALKLQILKISEVRHCVLVNRLLVKQGLCSCRDVRGCSATMFCLGHGHGHDHGHGHGHGQRKFIATATVTLTVTIVRMFSLAFKVQNIHWEPCLTLHAELCH
jgi:hypothetical protein